ncbi:hypothetical protein E4U41_005970 [Claviceps citrina]|nr:hypothetical protein E4U41_005970 [Claviceps citrina]
MSSPYSDTTPGAAVRYAYMFEKDKGPTKQFDALLRAVARHVVTGCQHTLQPTGNDFEAPSIPALTFRGFSRWESLEVLLGPEEHVPFLQYAVQNWNLKHPETGQQFPTDLPVSCFPPQADQEVDRWHKICAAKLWTAAASSSNDEEPASKSFPAPEKKPKPEPRSSHVHGVYAREPSSSTSSPNPRHAAADYFERPSYSHVPRRHASQRKAEQSPDRRRRDMATDDRGRRRSLSDYASLPPGVDRAPRRGYSSTYLDPRAKRSGQARPHSHPRGQSSASSEEDAVPDHRQKRHRHPGSPPPPSIRRFVPNSARLPPRLDSRTDDTKRRGMPSPLGSFRNRISETVSNILPNGLTSERPWAGSRQNSGTGAVRARRSPEQVRPSRLNQTYSDMDTDDSGDAATLEGEAAARTRRRLRDERERDKERERERERERDRYHQSGRVRDDWADDKELELKRGKSYLRRSDTHRRTSSHADIDRQRDRPDWDARDRERERDRDRDRERLRDERRRWGRRLSPEDGMTSPAAMASRQMHAEAAHG